MAAHFLQRVLELVDALAHPAAVDLELRLARSPAADAARQARHGRAFAEEARQQVFQLGQLDLELAFAGLGALGENVQDQLRAVDDLDLHLVGDRTDLARVQLLVEDDDRGPFLEGLDREVPQLAGPDEEAVVHLVAQLDDAADDLDPARARELLELGHRLLGAAA